MEEKKLTGAAKKLQEVEFALKREKDWRDEGKEALDIHDGKRRFRDAKSGKTFNILWANVDTKRQAIYSANPQPDIRKRWKVADKVADASSELMERVSSCILDNDGTEQGFVDNVLDMLLPGRAVLRVKYDSEVSEDEVGEQKVYFQPWMWDKFTHGPAKKWSKVPWICYEHNLSKEDVEDRWGEEVVEKLTWKALREDDKGRDEGEIIYEETTVYEFWNKSDRTVYWLGKGYADDYLEKVEDPLELRGFFDCPRPLYAIETSHTLIPQTEYSKYRLLAEELEVVSTRLKMIADAIRVRGVYDSSLSEIEGVLNAGDNEFIPAENVSKFMERGGLDKAIWFLPIEMLVGVRSILEQQRESLKRQISEIMGISDIVRGMTNPNETAAAQELKSSWASNRLEKQKQGFQRFVRDALRIAVELVAENFSRENLSAMTGLQFPTRQDQQMAQQQMQMMEQQAQQMAMMAQQSGQEPPPPPEPPPEIQQVLESITWEDIEEVLQDDYTRKYRIDIETDSTIRVDEEKDKEDAGFLMKAIADFSATAGQAVQAGMMTPEAANELIKSMVQKFRLGRDVVDAFSAPPPQEGPSPEEMKMQMEQQKAEAEAQMKQQEHQMSMQLEQMKIQNEQQIAQINMQLEQMKAQTEQQKAQADMQKSGMEMQQSQAEHAIEMESLQNKSEYEEKKHTREMQKLNASQE